MYGEAVSGAPRRGAGGDRGGQCSRLWECAESCSIASSAAPRCYDIPEALPSNVHFAVPVLRRYNCLVLCDNVFDVSMRSKRRRSMERTILGTEIFPLERLSAVVARGFVLLRATASSSQACFLEAEDCNPFCLLRHRNTRDAPHLQQPCRFPPSLLARPIAAQLLSLCIRIFTHCQDVRHQRVRSPWRAIARYRRWGGPLRRPLRTVITAANDANQPKAIPPPIRVIPVLPIFRPLHHR